MQNPTDGLDARATGDSRRRFLRTGIGAAAGVAALSLPNVSGAEADDDRARRHLVDGNADPFPIPWLDRNGSHGQVPAPGQEPSHIFHFRGDVARCNGFSGMGTDGHGHRLRFGGPTTDIGLMRGEYTATDGTRRSGAFLHL